MGFWALLLLVIIVQVVSFQQNDYKLIHERISLDWYNKSWTENAVVNVYHHTRTERRLNVSFHLLQDVLGNDVTNTVQGYKFQSNEYRLFPLNYSGNACELQKSNTFGTDIAKYNTNFTMCPTKKGYYYASDLYIDETKFPPYAPRGRYMLDIQVYYNKTILMVSGKWYGEIKATDPLERVIVG